MFLPNPAFRLLCGLVAAVSATFLNAQGSVDDYMIGVQLDKAAFEDRPLEEMFAEMRDLAGINAVFYFFAESDINLGEDFDSETPFALEPGEVNAEGQDLIDRMIESAAKYGIDVYLGGGEMFWGNVLPRFPKAAEIDYESERRKTPCVNRPEWREFQMAVHAEIFRQKPKLAGFLLMHERTGPMMKVFKPEYWQGSYNPGCFCEHCLEIAENRGIDADDAREGFAKLVELYSDEDSELRRDGVMIGMWRIVSEHPEVMAWEHFQWGSLHDYRAEFAETIRAVDPEDKVGYHFQHAGLTGDFPWRAGDRPDAPTEYADFVKPSIYPGVSGSRYKALVDISRETWLADLDEETAHAVLSQWFGRSPREGEDVFGKYAPEHVAFGPQWCRTETARYVKGAAPLPVYAGLGIGVPGGEEAEGIELIRECTEACIEGGADGFILSRHYSEMRPELLQAAAEVIHRHRAELANGE
ncbi:MAG: hypothetical protein ACFB21_00085 [Opitutales bacterium]